MSHLGGGLFKMVVMTSHSRFEPYISKAKEDRKKEGKRTQLTNNDGRGVEERERERREKREEREERKERERWFTASRKQVLQEVRRFHQR